jgi:FAD/FMN-containing dehydrogenase/Fe-S oxidoreductase
VKSLVAALRRAGVSDVDSSELARALYSSDASLYRVRPRLVVRPRHPEEIAATLAVCREHGVPLTARGAGTSIAGNAIGPGVVLDTSRHLNQIGEIDTARRTAVVQPGVVHASLQRAATAVGLRFGPDPSSHTRCTIGGMIGNNACGSRALAFGRTSDNVVALDVVDGAGKRHSLSAEPTQLPALHELVEGNLATIRTQFGRFPRQGSGYALEYLLPERGFDVRRALVGSEGTLVLVERATVRLVEDAPERILIVLGYPTMADAADATPSLLDFRPTACEGLDERIVAPVRIRPELPPGRGWLMVELAGDRQAALISQAEALIPQAGALGSRIVTDKAEIAAMWRIREDGAGLVARGVDGRRAHSGWEDAAVPVEKLGSYLRELDVLLAEYDLTGAPYGHFGDGCVHLRLDFPFDRGADRGREVFRRFLADAAKLVTRYGGSVSGEHGDGRARSDLLSTMYSPEAIALFSAVKAIFDPDNILNPGVLVRPDASDAAIRVREFPPMRTKLALAYPDDGGDLAAAVHRCTGVGKCRVEQPSSGQVMCPSFVATREEKDSTRGRARVLQDLVRGDRPDWRAPEVHEVLDLCLSCKGCASDCPTGVDMATWKTEVLHQAYKGRFRPLSHYTLGRLPHWADLAARAPRLVNRLADNRLTRRLAGVDRRRALPALADRTFGQDWAPSSFDGPKVVLWVDSFTDHFAPQVARAAASVLEKAGYHVDAVTDSCCALTWITTGQLDKARSILAKTLRTLDRGEAPIVGLEPSCTAVLRHDAGLLLDDPATRRVAGRVRTLAEQLAATPGWQPPDLTGTEVVAQPHCHHHAVMGWSADADVLHRTGAKVTQVGGCCGLAGNWGAERGHHDLSYAIAQQQLLPALEKAGVVALADGFSCRTQIKQFSTHRPVHLAELLNP